MDYGFGAVFGCPAHDQRDFDFSKKYNLEIKTVVRPNDKDENYKVLNDENDNITETFLIENRTEKEAEREAMHSVEVISSNDWTMKEIEDE